jgi:hypothetical protein
MITVSLMGSVGVPGWGAEGGNGPTIFFWEGDAPRTKKIHKKIMHIMSQRNFLKKFLTFAT